MVDSGSKNIEVWVLKDKENPINIDAEELDAICNQIIAEQEAEAEQKRKEANE